MGILDDWLLLYSSQCTKNTYITALKSFFKTVHGIKFTERISTEELRRYVNEYFESRTDEDAFRQRLKKHINTYYVELRDQVVKRGYPYAPKSANIYFSTTQTFFEDQDIELPKSFWKRFKSKSKGKIRPVHNEKIPTKPEIVSIFTHLPLEGLSYFSAMATSGMRKGEVAEVQISNLFLDEDPARIYIPESKKNFIPRHVFIAQESVDLIREWMKVRVEWIHRVNNLLKSFGKGNLLKDPDTDDLFPFTAGHANQMWVDGLKGSELFEVCQRTGIVTIVPHTLRKIFNSEMKLVIPGPIVHTLLGQEGYSDDSYLRYSVKKLGTEYLKGVSRIVVLNRGIDVEELTEKARQQTFDMKQLQQQYVEQGEKILQLQLEVKKLLGGQAVEAAIEVKKGQKP